MPIIPWFGHDVRSRHNASRSMWDSDSFPQFPMKNMDFRAKHLKLSEDITGQEPTKELEKEYL